MGSQWLPSRAARPRGRRENKSHLLNPGCWRESIRTPRCRFRFVRASSACPVCAWPRSTPCSRRRRPPALTFAMEIEKSRDAGSTARSIARRADPNTRFEPTLSRRVGGQSIHGAMPATPAARLEMRYFVSVRAVRLLHGIGPSASLWPGGRERICGRRATDRTAVLSAPAAAPCA